MLTDFLKEDQIVLPEIVGVKRKLIPDGMVEKFNAIKELDEASGKQLELGLGIPRSDLNPELEKVRKEIYAYNRSRLLKAGFKMVIDPPEKYFPRFATGKVPTFAKKPPVLAMAHLTKDLNRIACTVNGNRFEAPIPRFPAPAIQAVEQVKALAPNAEFHLLFLPSWGAVPQRDPILLAKVQGKYFQLAAWGTDVQALEAALLKK